MTDSTPPSPQSGWQHRIQRLLRAIAETRWDTATRPIVKEVFRRAIEQRKKINRAGWWN